MSPSHDHEVQPDSASLRVARRERVVAAMQEAGIEILVIGSEPNARYVSGVPRLWINGSHPFGPGCVFVRDTQDVHLVLTWDEGVPEEIQHEHLHGITFNGANSLKMLQGVAGAATARRVATDGLMGGTPKSMTKAFPQAELADGEQLLLQVRSTKLPEEVEAIRASIGIAERALEAAADAVKAGITERQLTGAFMHAMATQGITTPTTQDIAWITSPTARWSRSSRDVAVRSTDLVALGGGLMAGGYIGELGRTVCVDGVATVAPDLLQRWDELWDRLIAACKPGASGADLFGAYTSAGIELPPMPVAHGLGLGNDLPLVTPELPRTSADQRLEAGQVLALTGYVWQEGVGAIYAQEPVLITDAGPEILSAHPFREAADR
jgi:Xaa-Pro aminopeptidase